MSSDTHGWTSIRDWVDSLGEETKPVDYALFTSPGDSTEIVFNAVKSLAEKIECESPGSKIIIADENFSNALEGLLENHLKELHISAKKGHLPFLYTSFKNHSKTSPLYRLYHKESFEGEKEILLRRAIISHKTYATTSSQNQPYQLIKDMNYLNLAETYGIKDQILA